MAASLVKHLVLQTHRRQHSSGLFNKMNQLGSGVAIR